MSTEWNLENWRHGQTAAERMCLQLLSVDGFTDLDPQCPLGGRDGRKDILCSRNDWGYVAAAYFPTEKIIRFNDIKEKFEHDLEGVKRNSADGIVFLTGQKLTPSERSDLTALAESVGAKSIIYHQERIRGILDSPIGFALRLEYLGIGMKPEEQMAFVLAIRSTQNRDLVDMVSRVESKLDQLLNSSAAASALQMKAYNVLATLSTVAMQTVPSGRLASRPAALGVVPDILSNELICELHGALMFERGGSSLVGVYRTFQVWIGGAGGTKEEAIYIPPVADAVPALMEDLINNWNANLENIKAEKDETKIEAIVGFHFGLLNIHPFADGNGRISRYLIQAQAQRLNLTSRAVVIRERATYAKAIALAQKGDLNPLREIIHQAITGAESKN